MRIGWIIFLEIRITRGSIMGVSIGDALCKR